MTADIINYLYMIMGKQKINIHFQNEFILLSTLLLNVHCVIIYFVMNLKFILSV